MRRGRAARFAPLLGGHASPLLHFIPAPWSHVESKWRGSHHSWDSHEIALPHSVLLQDAAPAPKLDFNLAQLNTLILF